MAGLVIRLAANVAETYKEQGNSQLNIIVSISYSYIIYVDRKKSKDILNMWKWQHQIKAITA